MKRYLIVIVGITLLNSCISLKMREITARNNGAKFWLNTPPPPVGYHWEYHGSVNHLNQANGVGNYSNVNDFHKSVEYFGSGKFINGQPDGDHRFDNQLVAGFHHYANGRHTGMTKTRNDMPQHLANVATAGLSAAVTTRNQSQGRDIGNMGTGTTDITQNYPEGYAYNVTTYVGQYQSDRYSFAIIYGVTTYATAKQNLEAGRSVYGGPEKSDRPGWFWIEKVPVRKGSNVKVGIVGLR